MLESARDDKRQVVKTVIIKERESFTDRQKIKILGLWINEHKK